MKIILLWIFTEPESEPTSPSSEPESGSYSIIKLIVCYSWMVNKNINFSFNIFILEPKIEVSSSQAEPESGNLRFSIISCIYLWMNIIFKYFFPLNTYYFIEPKSEPTSPSSEPESGKRCEIIWKKYKRFYDWEI